MTPAARRGCAESVARSPVRAASCALPTNRAWCVHVASLVGVGVNQRRALLLVRPSVRPLVSLDLYIVLPIESPRTHSAYYAHAIRRSFADSPQAGEHEHESPQWAATAARQHAAPGRLTQRARLTWETSRPHCPLLTVYTCTHLNTHREPRRGCSVAPHTGFSPAHTHAGGACYLVTLLAATR